MNETNVHEGINMKKVGSEMKLSKLIELLGDENVSFQNLDKDITNINTDSHGVSHITFGTKAQTTLNGTEKLGVIMWLDRDNVEKVIEEQS